MKLNYKQSKLLVAHCGDCGQQFTGNGSTIHPYICNCGTWKTKLGEDYNPLVGEFELITPTPNSNN